MAVTISGSGQIVKQVLQTVDTTRVTTTSSSFVTSGILSVTITPTSASNKILIMVTLAAATDVNNAAGYYTIYRNGTTNLASSSNGMGEIYYNPTSSGAKFRGTIAMNFLDSPATTSPVTYQVWMKNNTVGTIIINDDGNLSTITAMEISGA